MHEFLLEHWRHIVFGGVIVVVLFGDKLKSLVGKIKIPKLTKTSIVNASTSESVETEDLKCILHLRDRAVEVKDEVLRQEVKSVANKFFDINSGIDTTVSK